MALSLAPRDVLPSDGIAGTLVGRVWVEGVHEGPRPVVLRADGLYDLSTLAPTLSDLFDLAEPAIAVRAHAGAKLMTLAEALTRHKLLAPCDLQAIKADGVTFADSLIERVIEERAKGDADAAVVLRKELTQAFGGSLKGLVP